MLGFGIDQLLLSAVDKLPVPFNNSQVMGIANAELSLWLTFSQPEIVWSARPCRLNPARACEGELHE